MKTKTDFTPAIASQFIQVMFERIPESFTMMDRMAMHNATAISYKAIIKAMKESKELI